MRGKRIRPSKKTREELKAMMARGEAPDAGDAGSDDELDYAGYCLVSFHEHMNNNKRLYARKKNQNCN